MNINKIRSDIDNFYNKKREIKNKQRSNYRNKKWNKYYGSKEWHDLRAKYYSEHCLCEACERLGYVKEANEIHHIKPFSKGNTEEEKYKLLLDYNNLCSLCKRHHDIAHEYMSRYNTDTATIEDILYYEEKNYTDFM